MLLIILITEVQAVLVTSDVNFGSGYFGTTAVASANADANGFGILNMLYHQGIMRYVLKI